MEQVFVSTGLRSGVFIGGIRGSDERISWNRSGFFTGGYLAFGKWYISVSGGREENGEVSKLKTANSIENFFQIKLHRKPLPLLFSTPKKLCCSQSNRSPSSNFFYKSSPTPHPPFCFLPSLQYTPSTPPSHLYPSLTYHIYQPSKYQRGKKWGGERKEIRNEKKKTRNAGDEYTTQPDYDYNEEEGFFSMYYLMGCQSRGKGKE